MLINESPDRIPYNGSKPETLKERMVQYSASDTWHTAIKEWDFVSNFRNPGGGLNCVCTQGNHPSDRIVDLNILVNRNNGNKARVGSVCIMEVMRGTQIENDYKLFKPTLTQERKGLPKQVAQRAFELKILTDTDLFFIEKNGRKRAMPAEAWDKLNWIKAKISLRFGPPVPAEIEKMVADRKDQPNNDPISKSEITITTKTSEYYTRKYHQRLNGKELSHMEKTYMWKILYIWYVWGPYAEAEEDYLASEIPTI